MDIKTFDGKTAYMLPNGNLIRLTESELKKFIVENGTQLYQPEYQGNSIESEQVGIKTN